MFVAKLPGSTYATAATNAGPEERPEAARALGARGERLLGGLEDPRLARQDVVERMDGVGAVVLRGRGGRPRAGGLDDGAGPPQPTSSPSPTWRRSRDRKPPTAQPERRPPGAMRAT